jgi:LysR family glycine cleavage system transcriptional activator
MRDLPLNALRAFAMIYDTGGIRPAARALEIAHSSVARHLSELEAWLGVALIERRDGVRTLAFTPQGEALGREAMAGLGQLDAAVSAVREARRGNTVVLSTTPSLAARWLLPRLAALAAAHPWIELSVVADQRLTSPGQDGIDLCIRMGTGPTRGLACAPLMDDALYPVMSPTHFEAEGRPDTPADLARLRLIHDRDPQAAWEVWRAAFGPPALDLRPGPRFASSDLVLRAAAQGHGVALARHRLAADDVASGHLVRPFGDRQVALPQAYWIVTAKTATRTAVSTLIDWLGGQPQTEVAEMFTAADLC